MTERRNVFWCALFVTLQVLRTTAHLHNSRGVESCANTWYNTIGNQSHFFMTLSCTEATQSFISHFNQYDPVDPPWGNIPCWVWQGVNHWFRKLWRLVRHFILETFFGNVLLPTQTSTNVTEKTYAPIQINWARNIASNYSNQQQPASSFITVSNVVVLLCEVRHQ